MATSKGPYAWDSKLSAVRYAGFGYLAGYAIAHGPDWVPPLWFWGSFAAFCTLSILLLWRPGADGGAPVRYVCDCRAGFDDDDCGLHSGINPRRDYL